MKLVLLPGMDGTGRLFAPLLSRLDDSLEPVVIAYPEHEQLDYGRLHQFVRARLPEGEPFVLLGESFSGPVALTLAAAAPAGLCGLILCATFMRNPMPVLAPLGRIAAYLPLKALPAWVVAVPLFGRASTRPMRKTLDETLAAVAPRVMRQRMHAVFACDLDSSACAIRVPALYLRASGDHLVSLRSAHELQACMPGLKIASLDAPHMLLQTRPAEAAELIHAFAAGLPTQDDAPPICEQK